MDIRLFRHAVVIVMLVIVAGLGLVKHANAGGVSPVATNITYTDTMSTGSAWSKVISAD